MRRASRLTAILVLLASCRGKHEPPHDEPGGAPSGVACAETTPDTPADVPQKKKRKPPNGAAPRLSCTSARALVADVEARLAAPVSAGNDPKLATSLADATIDWADPHGLWTASPDSPVAPLLRARAAKLRAVLEGKADCAAEMKPIGEAIAHFVADLRTEWDAAKKTLPVDMAAKSAMFDGAFEDGALTKPAKVLARELASRAAIAAKVRPEIAADLDEGRDRWLPVLDANAWAEVVLAAAVRAYVPLVDPHGAWAPSDESATLYDRDLELAPPPRLWTSSTRTAVGVRLDAGAVAPLREGDVVISVDGISVAGLSAEAIDQLAEAPEGTSLEGRTVRVVRFGDEGKAKLVKLTVQAGLADEPAPPDPLPAESVPYGAGRALILKLDDVPDALGEDLARAIAAAKAGDPITGIVLDLRGNGGGSIDGATGALGVFLPGAPLFPLKHRDGAIETERAAEPPSEDRWNGPVAAIVDGGTASAAEMIAGALHAYRRGPVVGTATYGKGCAQEYVDDVTGVGVLRLTTLLFALPDGSPVQRVGIRPDIAIKLPPPIGVKDHEADLLRAAPTWTGPDVRDAKRVVEISWPPSKAIGPCKDEAICRALRAVSSRAELAKR
ncbi:MAG: S41 family peptidase [Polyangiales bacterium]